MKCVKAVMSVVATIWSCAAVANPYQVDISGYYRYIDSKQSEAVATAQMFFAPVVTNKHVLAEASFIERVSNMRVSYGSATFYYDGNKLFSGNRLVDFTQTELSVDWFSDSGLYLALYKETYAVDKKENLPDVDNWGTKLGFTPMQGILVYTSYEDETGYRPNFSVKYVSAVSSGRAVNLEASYIDSEGDTRNFLMVGADIYFSRFFSFGGTISQQDDTIFGLRTRYFFTPAYSMGAFARTGDDLSEFGITLGVRF